MLYLFWIFRFYFIIIPNFVYLLILFQYFFLKIEKINLYKKELKIIDIGQNPIKNIDDLDELKKIEYIYLPQYCTSKNLDRKLKNNINDNMDGRIITNYKVYFNKYYISSMGFSINRLAFKL